MAVCGEWMRFSKGHGAEGWAVQHAGDGAEALVVVIRGEGEGEMEKCLEMRGLRAGCSSTSLRSRVGDKSLCRRLPANLR